VKQRHRGDEDVAGIDAHAVGGVGAVVEQSAMAEQGAFRKAVVPEVYWIMTGSSGLTAGSLMLVRRPRR
jgi:hypothetical protein